MKMGDKSEFVKVLREDLLKLGYWSVNPIQNPLEYAFSDEFESSTEVKKRFLYSALKTFQFEHKDKPGIAVNGELNKATAEAILEAYNSSV
jgi:hypothetical protein